MTALFLIQLIASFLIGGGLVALFTVLGERASGRIAGLLLGLPTTAAVSFFFLGWTLGPDATASIAPGAIIPLAIAVLFVTAYVHIANTQWNARMPKKQGICFALLLSYILWSALALPMPFVGTVNLPLSLLLYTLIMLIPLVLLTIRKHSSDTTSPLPYTRRQTIIRACFAGTIIMLSVLLGNTLGPLWGALFAQFPASFTSMLVIFHWHYPAPFLFKMTRHLPIGSTSMLIFLIAVTYTFPYFGFVGGTVLSYLITLLYSYLLSFKR